MCITYGGEGLLFWFGVSYTTTSSRFSNSFISMFVPQSNVPSLWGKYFCPCVSCANGRRQTVNDIRSHLICDGIVLTYTK